MITVEEMRNLEENSELDTSALMENAGREFVKAVTKKYDLAHDTRVVIFAGTGNNAGDGYVVARYFSENFPVIVLVFGEKMTEEAKKNFDKLKNPINIVKINSEQDLEEFHFQDDLSFLLVDAMLGLGVKGEVQEPISAGVKLFNKLLGIKVALDVPTPGCQVDLTVTLHDLKEGLDPKKTVVVDIGL